MTHNLTHAEKTAEWLKQWHDKDYFRSRFVMSWSKSSGLAILIDPKHERDQIHAPDFVTETAADELREKKLLRRVGEDWQIEIALLNMVASKMLIDETRQAAEWLYKEYRNLLFGFSVMNVTGSRKSLIVTPIGRERLSEGAPDFVTQRALDDLIEKGVVSRRVSKRGEVYYSINLKELEAFLNPNPILTERPFFHNPPKSGFFIASKFPKPLDIVI